MVLNGKTDVKSLQEKGVHIWDEWATKEQCAKFGREEGDLGPIYGFLWRHFGAEYLGPEGTPYESTEPDGTYRKSGAIKYGGVDQIRNLITEIQKNPGSRRLIVSGWDPRVATKVALPPCHTLFQLKIIVDPNKAYTNWLDLSLYMRSCDSFLGCPFNIASYSLLAHLIAHVCGLQVRNFICSFGDLHIYDNHTEQVNEQLIREPFKLPTIAIDPRLADGGFDALMDFKWEDLKIHNYQHHEAIKAPVAV